MDSGLTYRWLCRICWHQEKVGQLKSCNPTRDDLQNLGGQNTKRHVYLCAWPELRDGWESGSPGTRDEEGQPCCQGTWVPEDELCGRISPVGTAWEEVHVFTLSAGTKND